MSLHAKEEIDETDATRTFIETIQENSEEQSFNLRSHSPNTKSVFRLFSIILAVLLFFGTLIGVIDIELWNRIAPNLVGISSNVYYNDTYDDIRVYNY